MAVMVLVTGELHLACRGMAGHLNAPSRSTGKIGIKGVPSKSVPNGSAQASPIFMAILNI